MKTVVIYKDSTDYSREVETFLNDFLRQTGHALTTLDPDSAEGASFCRAYDVVEYPSIVALSDDSQMQNIWRGLPLPTISELSYYAN